MISSDLPPVILYVDDEWANRIVFEQGFAADFTIVAVASGTEALEILGSRPVGVLVTDQRMPDMDGTQLLDQVKRSYPDVVRMIVTAYSDLEPILRAVNEGLVARYIVKPWDHEERKKVLAWGLEAFTLGQGDRQLQSRLIETERLATLGSIASSVMHDLKQPIAVVDYGAQRLIELGSSMPALAGLLSHAASGDAKNLKALAEELPQISEDSLSASRLILDIVSTLNRMVKPSDGKRPMVPADPVAAIHFVITMSKSVMQEARARLVYDGPTKLPKVRLGQTDLIRVLLNLVVNGGQAVGRLGVRGKGVVITASETEQEVRFCVSDDGPGMSPEVLAKVGTAFFSERPGGTGLGVNQCTRLVKMAGGNFEISSTEGKGTQVNFSLPKVTT